MAEHYDVIIVGTGAGGGTLAHTLAPSGKRILLLERGDFLPREMDNWSPDKVFVDGKYISEDTWYDGEGTAFQPQVHYFVGGATKLYGAALYRLRPEDFGEIRHVDGVSPAWPVDYGPSSRSTPRPNGSTRSTGTTAKTRRRGRSPSRIPHLPSVTSRDSKGSPTPSRPRVTTRFRRRSGSCSTRRTAIGVTVSAARGAMAIPAWSMPRLTPRSWRCGRASSHQTSPF